MKHCCYYISLICLCALSACGNRSNRQSVPHSKTVKTAIVQKASSLSVLQFPGKVKAAHDINLAFRVSGTIESIEVKEGMQVHKGELLARLDPTDYEIQLQATKAEYQQVKGEAERVIALYKENGTTPNDYDKARYGLRQIEAKYRNHQDQLEYTRLYAPFDGFVQKKLFDAHETVGAGMPVLSLISKDTPEVELNIPASEYIRRNSFEKFSCTFDLYPGKNYPLKLLGITEKANANQLHTMRLKLDKTSHPLPSPGMNTMVSIHYRSETETVYSIPSNAIGEKKGKEYVYVYSAKDSSVHCVEVHSLHLSGNGTTFVTSPALKEGDRIVSSGIHHIKEGDKVRILKPVSTTNEGGLL